MKYARKRDRLAARQKSFDGVKRGAEARKRPGSFKDRGDGAASEKGRSSIQTRSRNAVNSRD